MCKERSKTMPWHVISACPSWLFKGNASDRYAGRLQRILILPKIWGDLVLDLYNLKSRNVTLLVPANAQSLNLHLVTEHIFSRRLCNCGTVFWWRSETFRALDLLKELSKRPFLIDLFIYFIQLFIYLFIYLQYSF